MRLKKIQAGQGNCNCVKEVLGWVIDTEAGTIALSKRNIRELIQLVVIIATQTRINKKDLEGLVGNPRSMHLEVPWMVAHLYHI